MEKDLSGYVLRSFILIANTMINVNKKGIKLLYIHRMDSTKITGTFRNMCASEEHSE